MTYDEYETCWMILQEEAAFWLHLKDMLSPNTEFSPVGALYNEAARRVGQLNTQEELDLCWLFYAGMLKSD